MRKGNARLLPLPISSGVWLTGACGLLALALPGNVGAQSSRPAPPADVFAQDARMRQNVKVRAPGLAVKDLLARLSATTGVMLTADKITAEDKVIVFSPARPLQATLADVAALFNDVWRRETASDGKPRYLLTRSLRASALEETLLNKSRNRLMAQLDAQVNALAETPEQLAKRPASDPIRESLTKAENRTATQVYAALSPEQRDVLFSRRVMNFAPNTISPQMREPIRKLYEASIVSIARFRPPDANNPPETLADYERQGIQFAIHSCGGRVTPAIYVYGKGSMHGSLFAELDARRQWTLPPHGNPYVQPSPALLPPTLEAEQTRKAAQEKQWLDQLRSLAALTGKPVVADFYRSQPINAAPIEQNLDVGNPDNPPAAKSQPDNDTPAGKASPDAKGRISAKTKEAATENIAALDDFCRKAGYLWWTRADGTVLFRKRDWYEQKLYEAPEDWLHDTVKHLAAQNNTPTLADFLRARQLTTQQILGLNSIYQGENYSYSEVEAVGATELLALLDRQLTTSPLYHQPMQVGRTQSAIYSVEGDSLTAARDTLLEFLNAQLQPFAFADIKFFRVDAVNSDRSPAPEAGFKDAELMLMCNWNHGAVRSYYIRLPLRLLDDRQSETVIEVASAEK